MADGTTIWLRVAYGARGRGAPSRHEAAAVSESVPFVVREASALDHQVVMTVERPYMGQDHFDQAELGGGAKPGRSASTSARATRGCCVRSRSRVAPPR